MGEIVKLPITEQMEWCDLIRKDNPIKELPYCYGYLDECENCEVKKYLDGLNKLGREL